ncbi:oxidoreductase [Obelidium mucronatum]|nr:oxidoreductase [Obelidium mucronatum]
MEDNSLLRNHFTESELAAAIKVTTALIETPTLKSLASSNPSMKQLMQALNRFGGGRNSSTDRSKLAKKRKLEEHHAKLEETGIRKLRKVGAMRSLPEGSLRGAFESGVKIFTIPPQKDPLLENAQSSDLGDLLVNHPSPTQQLQHPQKLGKKRICHICYKDYTILHHFYDRLCPGCADFNYSKRIATADLSGRVCLVTGGRVKIGYTIALKLLRSKAAKVIVTTRFPNDAAARFAAEHDAASFNGRLAIYGVDFRSISMVHAFCNAIKRTESRLDVLINNAAQTVRKPPAFYQHLMDGERKVFKWNGINVFHSVVLADEKEDGGNVLTFDYVKQEEIQVEDEEFDASLSITRLKSCIKNGNNGLRLLPAAVSTSAAMSQIAILPEDVLPQVQRDRFFPPGQLDRHLQQIDYRPTNSWVMEIDQVHTGEMIECHTINSFAPWILISEFKELMESTTEPYNGTNGSTTLSQWNKYIVNVSAMEGQFNRQKSTHHPHTNMAKASLNMLTRTCAAGFAQVGIYMTAVDTGWVTNELPLKEGETELTRDQPPLDEVDGAMRVLDPVFSGVSGEKQLWGIFLKDYSRTQW